MSTRKPIRSIYPFLLWTSTGDSQILKTTSSSVSPPIFRTAESTSRAEGFIKALVDIPLRDSDRICLSNSEESSEYLLF